MKDFILYIENEEVEEVRRNRGVLMAQLYLFMAYSVAFNRKILSED